MRRAPADEDCDMASSESPTQRRRIVTGHRGGKAVVLSDTPLATYAFRIAPGFEHAYVWKTQTASEAEPDEVDLAMPRSALPPGNGSLLHVVTFPPAAARVPRPADAAAVAQEYSARLPGLADTFEHDGSQMHVTPTIDYAILLDGELWLELDDGEAVHLSAGDIVVQQATRHGWRNKSERPATIAFVMLGADR